MPDTDNPLSAVLRAEIAAAGPISFARFMEHALYHPAYGYYQQSCKQIGCQGDFYTSVSVGNLFGQLLAFQFAAWLEPMLDTFSTAPASAVGAAPRYPTVQLVEAGAHDGRLAADILTWLGHQRPDLLPRINYWILEPSAARRMQQAELLRAFPAQVRWFNDWTETPAEGVHGVVFCNEFLDALPVYRLGWDARAQAWFEWRVGWNHDQFIWLRAPIDWKPLLGHIPEWRWPDPELLAVLPDGYTIELCPAARFWWSQATARLRGGKLLTFDYGFDGDEVFAPHRPQGTLRSYRSHQLTSDPLAQPGQQDLTAHVNFSTLRLTGEAAGLRTETFSEQGLFLTRLLSSALAVPDQFGAWDPAHNRQLQTLTHPQYLGRAFRVLVQTKSS